MKKIIAALISIAILTITVFAEVEPTANIPPEDELAATTSAQGMSVGAKAAIVIEAQTGRVLFEQNANDKLLIASTTKIMTALLALEQPDIDVYFTVDPTAIKVEGSSMGLVEGDKVSLRTLAVGMLLASGNDAANSVAVRISGSNDEFAVLMNARAKELGMLNTHFSNPSGLDDEQHYSTAYDMALLASNALKNDEFAAICSQYKMRASYGNPPYDRWLTNHNKLLNYYEGTVGMKTGFTKKAGRCLVTAAKKDGITLITVTLNCPNDWVTHESLYDRYFGEMQVEDLSKNIPLIAIPVTGGVEKETFAVKYDTAQFAIPTQGANIEYKVSVQPFLYAPVTKGQAVGEAEIILEGVKVATISLVSDRDIPPSHPYVEKKGVLDWIKGLFA